MLKVKIFDEEHEIDLEEKINDFLCTIDESQFKEIKYEVACLDDEEEGQVYCFSAMIVYRE